MVRTPNRFALGFAYDRQIEELSYAELNIRANRLAYLLMEKGIQVGDRVGIHCSRSVELVVAVLGVMKSGAAYVPIEPDYPERRRQFIAHDAQLSAILHQPSLRIEGDFDKDIEWIPLSDRLDSFPESNPNVPILPHSPAYLIYTSGSTGTPKGVLNSHRGICNRILWMQQKFSLQADDRILQKTSFGFDVSVLELLWPLVAGAGLEMAVPGGHRDAEYLIRTLSDRKISTIHFVPSMLRVFLDGVERRQPPQYLRRVLCSGEPLTAELVRRFHEAFPASVSLHNFYGPTEAAVDVTFWDCDRKVANDRVPIGKPISNTQIYILDGHMRPVPIGVHGEIFIGGTNVGLGYWNRPELNECSFVKDPFGSASRGRLFRTRDLGRYDSDGNIEFLGRADRQIKIRGQRVELGEIETVLGKHPSVEIAIVTGDLSLVSYLVLNASVSVGELRRYLIETIPDFMIPAHFVFLDEIPLTPNAKIDFASLPKPELNRTHLESRYVPPETAVERQLVGIWEAVLEVDGVGIDDNFFDLGGDSLRSIEVVFRSRELGIQLTLQQLIQYPQIRNLAGIAAHVDPDPLRDSARLKSFALVPENDKAELPKDIDDAYPLTMLQKGLVFHSSNSQVFSNYITSYYVESPFDPEVLRHVLASVTAKHAILRTSFELARFSVPIQIVHSVKSCRVDYEEFDWTHLTAEEQEAKLTQWINEQCKARFDWQQAPLIRFFVHRRRADRFQFSIVEPFLDGWSVALLASEIFQLYGQILTGEYDATPSDELNCSYGDFVSLEERSLLSESRHFWLKKLVGIEKTFLPNWPSSSTERETHVRKTIVLDTRVVDALKSMAKELAFPLKSVLFACYLRVIGILTGKSTLVTGLMMNGRPEMRDGDRLIGLFLNVVPAVVKLPQGSWKELIQLAHEVEIEALPHRRYPLAQMQIDANSGPFFDSIFNFIHFRQHTSIKDIRIVDRRANDQTYFPLTVQFAVDWKTGGIELSLDFNVINLNDSFIQSVSERFVQVLSQAAKCHVEDGFSKQIQLLPKEESLLNAWNSTAAEVGDRCFPEVFESIARKFPSKVAIQDDRSSLTYRELNDRAGLMAMRLLERGVEQGSVVGVFGKRNVDFLVVLIAIQKMGAVYLPIGQEWPIARVQESLDCAEAKHVVCIEADFKQQGEILQTCIGVNELADNTDARIDLDPKPTLTDLAYIIFTSGSTGRPKGAMIEHGGMLNHLQAKVEDLELTEDSVVAQTANQCFDISVWQFLAPLLVGGRVEVASDHVIRDPELLSQFIHERQVSVFETVPLMLRAILSRVAASAKESASLSKLKWLLVTGEAFPVDLCAKWFEFFPGIPVVNAYGPTECSDDVTHHIVRKPPESAISTIPIGKPIRNTQVFVLDPNGIHVPVGVPGELYVGGQGVGRGYIGDSDETSKSFLPIESFPSLLTSLEPNMRVYRSGDLGRYLPNGTLEFLGRIDRQIKVRGHRIEIDEIEHIVRQTEDVHDALVTTKLISGAMELVCYYVSKEPIEVEDLKNSIAEHLPPYAMPAAFVRVDQFAENANGKIDHEKLPAPTSRATRQSVEFTPPSTDLEKRVASIWRDVLDVDEIGIHDDFFAMGGHSLSAVVVVSKMVDELKLDVSIKSLLENATISKTCEAITRGNRKRDRYTPRRRPNLQPRALDESFGCVSYETRSISKLVQSGSVAPIHSAALGYIPNSVLDDCGLDRDLVVHDLLHDEPVVRRIFDTPFGRIGHIMLPITGHELYSDGGRLQDAVMGGCEFARKLGAGRVSLTGLIPSALYHGESQCAFGEVKITTGHATTTAAVAISVDNLLTLTNRDLSQESLGVVGVGSIGLASLKLILSVLPKPREVHLCDAYGVRKRLETVEQMILSEYGIHDVHLHMADGSIPPSFYQSTLIVGATNVAGVLDVDQLLPGTLIVDDSAPHCFDESAALSRIATHSDMLVTEGGILRAPEPIRELRYAPSDDNFYSSIKSYRISDCDIMGCILSSVLPLHSQEDLSLDIGSPNLQDCRNHRTFLLKHAYSTPAPCLGDTDLSFELLRSKFEHANSQFWK